MPCHHVLCRMSVDTCHQVLCWISVVPCHHVLCQMSIVPRHQVLCWMSVVPCHNVLCRMSVVLCKQVCVDRVERKERARLKNVKFSGKGSDPKVGRCTHTPHSSSHSSSCSSSHSSSCSSSHSSSCSSREPPPSATAQVTRPLQDHQSKTQFHS